MNLVRLHNTAYAPTMNDLFNELFNDLNVPAKRNVSSVSPAVNILENKNSFELEFSVPGYKKEDFAVTNSKGVLSVKAELKEERKNENYTLQRFSVVSFERSFNIPEEVDTEAIKASYSNGILRVELPKKELEPEKEDVLIPVD